MFDIKLRNYRPDDLEALVALINEADAVDQLERGTTVEQLGHELSFPTASPETDLFLAVAGDRLVGYTDLYVQHGNPAHDKETTVYCWGVVHPDWRRRGVGRRLLEASYRRASECLPGIEVRRVRFQCSARDVSVGAIALFKSLDMERVRYFVNLAQPFNGSLPPVEVPEGIQLRTFEPARDAETVWRLDNEAFRDHWGHAEDALDDFLHWLEWPHLRPDLWFLAEDTASNRVVGMCLNVVDPDWIAQTGRQEGYVNTLAVLREHRQQGLGTALLVRSLHALRGAGMEAVHLHADADNLTGAMRLYERVGFRVRKTLVAYHKVLREG